MVSPHSRTQPLLPFREGLLEGEEKDKCPKEEGGMGVPMPTVHDSRTRHRIPRLFFDNQRKARIGASAPVALEQMQ